MDHKVIFEHIQAALVVLSPEYKVLDATDKYLETTMQTREKLIGQDFLEAFPDNPDDPGSKNMHLVRQSLDRAKETKKIDHLALLRYDIPRPEAEGGFDIRYWEATHQPLLDDKGELLYIIQKTSDVTEREMARLALSESEEKFKFMADAMPQLIDTNDPSGKSTYFNARWMSYTGLSNKELLHGGWRNTMHPDDLPQAEQCWEEAQQKGEPCQFDTRIRDAAGEYRWFLTRYQPMSDEQGNIIMWIGSCTDINATKKLVEEVLLANEEMAALADQVQQTNQQLEEEKKTLENLIMKAPAIFCILKGPEHRYELVNPEYARFFPARDLLGKTVAEAVPEAKSQGFLDLLDNVYNTGEEFVAMELPLWLDNYATGKKDEIYIDLVYQAIYTNGKISGILVYGNEVTEKVKCQKLLQEALNAK